jgi:hypothetical protein
VNARSFAWAGLATGPAAWAVSTQINYAIVPWACARGVALLAVPGVAALLVLVAVAGGVLSWRAWRSTPAPDRAVGGHPHHFLGAVSAGLAALFALLIALHALGALFFTGCEW